MGVQKDSFSPFSNVSLKDWNSAVGQVLCNTWGDGVAVRLGSKINHCCDPNAGVVVDDGCLHVFALRTIHPGEEITVQYAPGAGHEDTLFLTCDCGDTELSRHQRYEKNGILCTIYMSLHERAQISTPRENAAPAFAASTVAESAGGHVHADAEP